MLHGAQPEVNLNTNFGQITIELFDDDTPGTVDNFLTYVSDGDYVNSIFHRLVPGFVLQGGGFTSSSDVICATAPCNTTNVSASLFATIPTDPPIANEPGLTNARGTVAMAKLATSPDSATDQFFVNLANNAGVPPNGLDFQNGGFTVFGRVTDMTVVDQIAAMSRVNLGSLFPPTSPLAALGAIPISGNRIPRVQSITGNAIIDGTVYLDNDGNGVKSPTELGMAGRRVFLDTNDSGVFDDGEPEAITEDDGYYFFRVAPGNYIVRADLVQNFKRTLVIGQYDSSLSVGRSHRDLDFGLKYSGTSWTNPLNNLDVDATQGVTLRDVLQIINEIRLRTVSGPAGELPPLSSAPSEPAFYDVTEDGRILLNDAVAVINHIALNQTGGAQQAASLTVWANPVPNGENEEISASEPLTGVSTLPEETANSTADALSAANVAPHSLVSSREHVGRPAARVHRDLTNERAFAEMAEEIWGVEVII